MEDGDYEEIYISHFGKLEAQVQRHERPPRIFGSFDFIIFERLARVPLINLVPKPIDIEASRFPLLGDAIGPILFFQSFILSDF